MKKTAGAFLCLALLFFTACPSIGNPDKTEAVTQRTKGWNDDSVAEYASYFHTLCRNAGYTAFWWDCNDLVDRNKLTCRKSIVDAIMEKYPEEEFHYEKTIEGFVEEDAAVAVHNMKTGWNLGNTLDSTSYDWRKEEVGEEGWIIQWGEKDGSGNVTVKAFETAWGMPVTTQKMIHYVKELGFNSVRVPCTWAEHLDENNQIDPKWMARVHEVVDYVINEGMYCVLNTHHDGWVCATEKMYDKYSSRFESVWKQIAEEFKDYDERLLFASMNEVDDDHEGWIPVTPDATLKYINRWNQLFIDTIRAQGGNHAKRNLVISPKGCSGSERDMEILYEVTDTAENHLIVEVHNYTPQGFCFKEASWTTEYAKWVPSVHEAELKRDFEVYAKWEKKIQRPVIIGEYAAFPKKYEDYQR